MRWTYSPRIAYCFPVLGGKRTRIFSRGHRHIPYTVKKVIDFPVPGCHWPNSFWAGIIKLFQARDSLVSDIPAGDGKINNLFLQCTDGQPPNCSGGGETFPGRAGSHRHGDYSGPHQLSRSLANRSLPFLTPTNQRLHLYSQLEASPPSSLSP